MKEWAVSLPRFDGPLDVLLSLVRRNQFSLADLPVSEITRQYLAYLGEQEELDVNLGAEYADLAATLIQLKSRLLLPRDPELAAREADPRQELVRQLLDREQVRQAAEFLGQRLGLAAASTSRSPDEEFSSAAETHGEPEPAPGAPMNLLEVVRLAQRALSTARAHAQIDTRPDPVPTEELIGWVETRLATLNGAPANALPWFADQSSPRRRVVLLLAILELVRRGGVEVWQPDEGEGIWLVAKTACGTTVP